MCGYGERLGLAGLNGGGGGELEGSGPSSPRALPAHSQTALLGGLVSGWRSSVQQWHDQIGTLEAELGKRLATWSGDGRGSIWEGCQPQGSVVDD